MQNMTSQFVELNGESITIDIGSNNPTEAAAKIESLIKESGLTKKKLIRPDHHRIIVWIKGSPSEIESFKKNIEEKNLSVIRGVGIVMP